MSVSGASILQFVDFSLSLRSAVQDPSAYGKTYDHNVGHLLAIFLFHSTEHCTNG